MKYFIVNAFADKPFCGNPAAVCIVENDLSENKMQLIATEFNLSETAFIEKKNDHFRLRWFSPRMEVDLCGHATLAGAHILWEQNIINNKSIISFDTNSGILSVKKTKDHIIMDFPRENALETECPEEIIRGLKIKPVFSGKNRFDYIVEVRSEEVVRTIKPDFETLAGLKTRGIIVTSISESESGDYDFVSRFFAPNAGIPEDPVTGSAHCCLGPYWSRKLNKTKLTGYQASERGGTVYVEIKEDRVFLGGNAVTFSSGKLID